MNIWLYLYLCIRLFKCNTAPYQFAPPPEFLTDRHRLPNRGPDVGIFLTARAGDGGIYYEQLTSGRDCSPSSRHLREVRCQCVSVRINLF